MGQTIRLFTLLEKEHWGALEGLEGGKEHDQFGVPAVGGCVREGRDWYPGWL